MNLWENYCKGEKWVEILKLKGNSLRKNVHDQQRLIDRNRGTCDIPIYEEIGSRGGNDLIMVYKIQYPNMVRHDWFKQN